MGGGGCSHSPGHPGAKPAHIFLLHLPSEALVGSSFSLLRAAAFAAVFAFELLQLRSYLTFTGIPHLCLLRVSSISPLLISLLTGSPDFLAGCSHFLPTAKQHSGQVLWHLIAYAVCVRRGLPALQCEDSQTPEKQSNSAIWLFPMRQSPVGFDPFIHLLSPCHKMPWSEYLALEIDRLPSRNGGAPFRWGVLMLPASLRLTVVPALHCLKLFLPSGHSGGVTITLPFRLLYHPSPKEGNWEFSPHVIASHRQP